MNPPRTTRLTALLAPVLSIAFAAGSASVSATSPPSTPPDSEPPASADSAPVDSAPVDTIPAELPEGYVWLVDDTGVITIAAPEAWADIDTAPAEGVDGGPQPWIAAAPSSRDAFLQSFDEPGLLYVAWPYDPDPLFLLDSFSITEDCSSFALEDFSSHGFTGLTNIGTGCGADGNATWQLVVASPADLSFTAMVQVQTVSDDDIEAVQLALDSFTSTGEPMPTIGSSVPGPTEPVPSAPATTETTETTEAAG